MPTVICPECGESVPCRHGHTTAVDISRTQTDWVFTEGIGVSPVEALRITNELIGLEAVATDTEANDVYHGFRPFPLGKFGGLFLAAYSAWKARGRTGEARFLEVGCGIGTKLVLIQEVFSTYDVQADGFDVDASLVEQADQLLRSHGLRGICDVWRDYAEDFDLYDDYDIVYLNRPIADYERMAVLEQHVFNTMQFGAILIHCNPLTRPPCWTHVASDIASEVWIKTCRCEGVEDYLRPVPVVHAGEQLELECRICDRDVQLMSTA
jgi:SAM-dependent methyltransferase